MKGWREKGENGKGKGMTTGKWKQNRKGWRERGESGKWEGAKGKE